MKWNNSNSLIITTPYHTTPHTIARSLVCLPLPIFSWVFSSFFFLIVILCGLQLNFVNTYQYSAHLNQGIEKPRKITQKSSKISITFFHGWPVYVCVVSVWMCICLLSWFELFLFFNNGQEISWTKWDWKCWIHFMKKSEKKNRQTIPLRMRIDIVLLGILVDKTNT